MSTAAPAKAPCPKLPKALALYQYPPPLPTSPALVLNRFGCKGPHQSPLPHSSQTNGNPTHSVSPQLQPSNRTIMATMHLCLHIK